GDGWERRGSWATRGRVAELDPEFLELPGVVQPVAVVPNAPDERPLAAELTAGDDRVGHAPAADQPRLVVAERLDQGPLLGRLDQPHRPLLEPERGELPVGQLQQDIDQGVAEPAHVELFGHVVPSWSKAERGRRGFSPRMKRIEGRV